MISKVLHPFAMIVLDSRLFTGGEVQCTCALTSVINALVDKPAARPTVDPAFVSAPALAWRCANCYCINQASSFTAKIAAASVSSMSPMSLRYCLDLYLEVYKSGSKFIHEQFPL